MADRFSHRHWLLALIAVASIAGCGLSPHRQDLAEQLLAEQRDDRITCPAHRQDRCALESPLHSGAVGNPAPGHRVVLLDQGTDALSMRIHLVRAAREQIVLMNYLFLPDDSGALLLDELAAAARRGVSVRVLVDGLFALPGSDLVSAIAARHEMLELKLYDPLFERAHLSDFQLLTSVACCFGRLNRRMHSKMMVVDGRHAIHGGRNQSDRYFDLDTRMSFIDFEVLVSGPVAARMVEDFDRYWAHSLSRRPEHLVDIYRSLKNGTVAWPLVQHPERVGWAEAQAEDSQWISELSEERGFNLAEVEYFSDPPDKRRLAQDKGATARIHELIKSAGHSVWIQTPYLVFSPRLARLLDNLDPQVKVVVSTNSLAATDAFPVYAISRRQRYRAVTGLGLEVYEFKPFPADKQRLVSRYSALIEERAAGISSPMRGDPVSATGDTPGPRLAVHAKLVVIDDEIVIVTSHNFDPRSENLNTENGLVFRDPALAAAVQNYIRIAIQPGNAWLVAPRAPLPPLIDEFNRGMAGLSRRLPTLDFWPFWLTQNYIQPQQAEPPLKSEPALEDYQAVGDMPGVVRYQRRFMTALISRLFGFLRTIM